VPDQPGPSDEIAKVLGHRRRRAHIVLAREQRQVAPPRVGARCSARNVCSLADGLVAQPVRGMGGVTRRVRGLNLGRGYLGWDNRHKSTAGDPPNTDYPNGGECE